jgi:predicted dehydrogenase
MGSESSTEGGFGVMRENMERLRWGVLSTAGIGMKKVIPAMQQDEHTQITAIASRDVKKAEEAASVLGIPKTFGSYDALLEDPDIDAVYIPLPNHLHVEYTEKALEHGKHVLCEKPYALTEQNLDRTEALCEEHGLLFGEAYMVIHHPQWQRAAELITEGIIGTLEHVNGFFSFYNTDANNIRNRPEFGGGSLYDIGVYPVVTTRFASGKEPREVCSYGDIDPRFSIDRLSTAIMRFDDFTASFTCSMQVSRYQKMEFFGSEGVLIIEQPFNAPNDTPTSLYIARGPNREDIEEIERIPACNQYTLQARRFYEAVSGGTPFAADIRHARAQKRVIDALYRSQATGEWELV